MLYNSVWAYDLYSKFYSLSLSVKFSASHLVFNFFLHGCGKGLFVENAVFFEVPLFWFVFLWNVVLYGNAGVTSSIVCMTCTWYQCLLVNSVLHSFQISDYILHQWIYGSHSNCMYFYLCESSHVIRFAYLWDFECEFTEWGLMSCEAVSVSWMGRTFW